MRIDQTANVGDFAVYVTRVTGRDLRGEVAAVDIVAGPYKGPESMAEAEAAAAELDTRNPGEEHRLYAIADCEVDLPKILRGI